VRWLRPIAAGILTFYVFTFYSAPAASAVPTQEDVFKSIQESVGPSQTDYSKLLPFALAAVGLVIFIAVAGQWRRREGKPRTLNHHGRLVKEVMKTVPLRASELRQLRVLAEEGREEPLQSPLTLVLCPSLLAEAIREHQSGGARGRSTLDRKVVLQLARKVGVAATKK
jgi:hypothetical protein